MRIDCPFCGPRPMDEFTADGAAGLVRPGPDAPEADWVAYVYERDNPLGAQAELFHHVAGCRAWLSVTRDTRDHAVRSVAALGERAR